MTAPSEPGATILHLGLGAFHRAHQAVFMQRLLDRGDSRWRLCSGNLRSDPAGVEAALARQGGAYMLETVSPDGERHYQRIRAIDQVLRWEPSLGAVLAVGADAATRIVSFTVTEAGYSLDSAGDVDLSAAAVAADLDAAREGRPGSTIYGALAAILRGRMRGGAGPLTLLCCDNLRHNGARTRAALLRFIEATGDSSLLAWARANTAGPNTMVDRITPRPSSELAGRVKTATGVDDEAPVMAETFIQWVVEDEFLAGRPDWHAVGVDIVASVEPYEEAKIRLLNATHSCIAWAGALAGHRYVHESSKDAQIRRFAHEYVSDDVIPLLSPSPVDLAAYRDTVLARFGNEAIPDSLQRVTADSFSKLAEFVAPTIRERLARDEPIESTAMLPALFLAFLQRWDRGEIDGEYLDQPADLERARRLCRSPDPLAVLAGERRVWGAAAGDPRLDAALRRAAVRVAAFTAARGTR